MSNSPNNSRAGGPVPALLDAYRFCPRGRPRSASTATPRRYLLRRVRTTPTQPAAVLRLGRSSYIPVRPVPSPDKLRLVFRYRREPPRDCRSAPRLALARSRRSPRRSEIGSTEILPAAFQAPPPPTNACAPAHSGPESQPTRKPPEKHSGRLWIPPPPLQPRVRLPRPGRFVDRHTPGSPWHGVDPVTPPLEVSLRYSAWLPQRRLDSSRSNPARGQAL